MRETAVVYLGSDVVRRSAERPRRSVADDALLAHAEVGDLDVSLGVQHHVVQLEISAHAAAISTQQSTPHATKRGNSRYQTSPSVLPPR